VRDFVARRLADPRLDDRRLADLPRLVLLRVNQNIAP
jgi:hypothetical protein